MNLISVTIAILLAAGTPPLSPGNHSRNVEIGGDVRSYRIHVPPQYDPAVPTPVVLAFHGAAMNASMMAAFSGLDKKADEAGFVAVYPNGTGLGSLLLVFNAGGWNGRIANSRPDDVAFVVRLLDDLATVIRVDPKRVYATGMSNGGMMCYRLAAELSDRIAAIAPVGGTLAVNDPAPTRPVPVIHFHGTADTLVPFGGPDPRAVDVISFLSVEESIRTWVKLNGCVAEPEVTQMPDAAKDGTTVRRKTYGQGKEGAEVVLFVVEGGGHTWPGQEPPFGFLARQGLGRTTKDISANDLLWEFFQRHPKK